jgi:hypothetical protein
MVGRAAHGAARWTPSARASLDHPFCPAVPYGVAGTSPPVRWLFPQLDNQEASMAKAKAKSKKNTGLPKTVAGVKVPKAVRQSRSLGTLINSPLGREILADALIAAAAAAAAALTRTRPAKIAGQAVADAGSEAASTGKDAVQTAAGAVAGVVTDAARSFLPSSLIGGDTDERGVENGSGRPRYAHRASDHSNRKRSKKAEKAGKQSGQ